MSQPGLLTEDELRGYMNEIFNLKLDRDVFIKPNKENIFDVYARFLDHFNLPWKEPNPEMDFDDSGPNLKFRMVGYLKAILSQYNTPFEFNMSDVLAPVKKRTTIFINILIFIKAQIDDAWATWQGWSEEWQAHQEEVKEIKTNIEQLKLQIEQIALAKFSSKTIEQLQQENLAKNNLIEKLQAEGQRINKEAKPFKESMKHDDVIIGEQAKELESLEMAMIELDNTLKKLNDGRKIKKTIQDTKDSIRRDSEKLATLTDELRKVKASSLELKKILALQDSTKDDITELLNSANRLFTEAKRARASTREQLIQAKKDNENLAKKEAILKERLTELENKKNRMNMQYKIKLQQSSMDLKKKTGDINELKQQKESEIARLRGEIDHLKMKRVEIATKRKAAEEKSNALIEQSNRKLELLKKKFQESKNASQKIIPVIVKSQKQIETLVGQPKEIDLPADRTYIKEPDRTYIKERANP